MKIILAFLVVSSILLSGCTTNSAAKMIAAAAKDKAKVEIKISGWGVNIEYHREMTPVVDGPVGIQQ